MEGREGVAVPGSEVGGGGGGGGGGSGGVGGGKESLSPSPSLTPSPPAPSGGGGMGVTVPHAVGMGMGMGIGIGIGTGMGMGISSSSGEDLARKKRGRPRKYGPDDVGGGMALALVPASSSPFSSYSFSGSRRGRGRPPGSGRRQLLATLGEWFAYSAGGNFTPHVVTVATGEDVAARILSFSQKGPRAICILSANGAISNVTLRQPGSSGGTLTYEGRFEILSLSGSFTITEGGGVRSRTGGISVSLAGPDGRVVGGGVAGSLLAASPIQVVVGSFLPNALKEPKRKSDPESSSYTAVPSPSILTAVRPVSQATPADEREPPTPTPMTLPAQIRGGAENSTSSSLNPSSTSFRASGWQGLQSSSSSDHRASPDINICLPGE